MSSTSRSARRSIRHRRPSSMRSARRTPNGVIRPSIGTPEFRERRRVLAQSDRRYDDRARRRQSHDRLEGGRGWYAPLASSASPRPRHRPVSGRQLPELRDGGPAGQLPGRRRSRRRRVADRSRRDRPGRCRSCALPLGEHPWQPGRRHRRPRGGRCLGPSQWRPRVQRRVLHRVHLGRPAPLDPRSTAPTASSPSTHCRSARISPVPGPASSPATPT